MLHVPVYICGASRPRVGQWRLERVWVRWSLFLPGQARSKSRWRPLLAAGGGRQRIEESGYTRFESGTPLQTGWKTRSVGTQNGGCTFVKTVAYARNVKRGRFDPVHHLWFGSSQRPRRGRIPWVFFRGVLWGVLLRYIVSIELQMAFVRDMTPGARLSEVSIVQTLIGTGTNLGLLGRGKTSATVPCKTND